MPRNTTDEVPSTPGPAAADHSFQRACRAVAPLSTFAIAATSLLAQAHERPPATPLVTHDPYFSIWSETDKLTDSPTRHWTGHPQQLTGLLRVDGKPFRIMGSDPRDIPALDQLATQLTPTHTRYRFGNASIELDLAFFTPAFLDDLDLLSRPVTYITWTARSLDGQPHDVSVYLGANPDIATSFEGQQVLFTRNQTAATNVLSVGSREQSVLNRSGDDLRIDWGYLHLATPKDEPALSTISPHPERQFAADGTLAAADVMNGPVTLNRFVPEMAVVLNMGKVTGEPVARHLLLSYTEEYAIQLLGQNLRPYWQRDNKPVSTMLDEAAHDYAALDARGNDFDTRLIADMTATAGEHYAWLCTLSYRQAIAAHKLVAGPLGEPMLFAKENFSNGDIATVDVLYPSSPMFLFFNPGLLKAQLLPVLEYAAMPNHWKFPFAPHDLGQYPLANGQEYGGGERTEEDQMPVEESGNLLILMDAYERTSHDRTLAERFWPQLTQWANYLKEKGLNPENQLSTDDFAGHLAHNANLSIKAIDGIAAYANIARTLGHTVAAHEYQQLAHQMAKEWVGLAKDGDHYKLAFDTPGSWSQKYNLVWDKVMGYELFPREVRETEIAFYKTKLNAYGLPLDSRKDYTKLDWEVWTATLADHPEDFNALIDPVYRWTNETKSRVPMTDWYDTITGEKIGFQARSVVGGVFIKALTNVPLADQYRAKATAGAPQEAHLNRP